MNLKYLNKFELDQRIKSLAAQERELLHAVLLTVKEIDQRRSYVELGFPNIFAYLVEGVGYSAGSAQRRIDAARLLSEVPSLGAKIQSGEVKLQQVSLIQKAAREVFKSSQKNVTAAEKLELLEQISSKSFQESQKDVAAYFDIPVVEATTQKVQADESVRVSLTLPKELAEKIQQAQGLLSHALGTNDLVAYLEYVTDRVIKQKTAIRSFKHTEQKSAATVAVRLNSQASNSKKESRGMLFSARTKKLALQESPACQHRDPISGKQCNSYWYLQTDHKHSRWAGGSNHLDNAQILCAQHNRLKYQNENGLRLIGK